ncbi:MAG: YSC84-related protein [Sulfurovaceae bacterium]|nr:YSC84-related protein [Sulfurovaceae bacterium]MDD5548578.1 YSC84-related protein [Sulfurovaceae bacterium]
MKKIFSILILFFACSTAIFAEDAVIINAQADIAVQKFYKNVKGGEDFLGKVKGYVVFPAVYKAGFIIGGEYGEGVLRYDGENKGYYSLTSGSIGYQIGAQKRAILIAFISQRALDKFLESNGLTVGVDGGINVGLWGASKDLSTVSFESDAIAFVFDETGLMGGIAIDGSKIAPIAR